MVLESTMICVDNSDYMRNGDFLPTRLQAQQDAVNLVCHSKTRSNPENNVGLLTLAHTEVLATLTSDAGRILTKLHAVQPKGLISFITGVRVAHLALKHRQSKNHKMRIVLFVGSPIEEEDKELAKAAKKLKKEKVNVDIVNFGEETVNTDKLTSFISVLNGKEGTSSHLVTVPPGPILSDTLLSSPIIVGEDGTGAVPGLGAGGMFDVDPNEDPELALALRVSMEEQRARQEDEARKAATQGGGEQTTPAPPAAQETNEDAMLEHAIAMSMTDDDKATPASIPDFGSMTEDEQIAYAMRMSLSASAETGAEESPMEVDDKKDDSKNEEEDYTEVMNDPAFLQSVLENLPGVDPQSDAIRQAMGSLTQRGAGNDDKKDDKKDDKTKK